MGGKESVSLGQQRSIPVKVETISVDGLKWAQFPRRVREDLHSVESAVPLYKLLKLVAKRTGDGTKTEGDFGRDERSRGRKFVSQKKFVTSVPASNRSDYRRSRAKFPKARGTFRGLLRSMNNEI